MRSKKRALIGYSIYCGLMALSTGLVAQPAMAQQHSFQIEDMSLSKALREYGRAAGRQIIFTEDLVRGKRAPNVVGSFAAEDALARLLAGSGLTAERTPAGAVMIVRTGSGESSSSSGEANAGSAAAEMQGAEIIVTAQKRDERLLDVPVPVAVASAQSLNASNLTRLQEYFQRIPGLNLAPNFQSSQTLSIRGITTGSGNPTVGTLIDDVPYGASTNNGGGRVVPDIDPSQLAGIEVLRGPQGTLYGASSMGGLLKFVTTDPSTDRLSGLIAGGVNTVHSGGDIGTVLRGSLNIPINDEIAVIASGFYRTDPGYFDNPVYGQKDVNDVRAAGGRFALMWRPRETVSLKIGAILQRIEGDGGALQDVGAPDLTQNKPVSANQFYRTSEIYTATLKAELAENINLISVTGYNINAFKDSFDNINLYASAPARGGDAAISTSDNRTTKFTQELRLAAGLGSFADLLVGGYYSKEHSHYISDGLAIQRSTGIRTGLISDFSFPSTYEDYAAFGDLTLHLFDGFDLQIGGRYSRINLTYVSTETRPGPVIISNPKFASSANVFSYLIAPSYKITPDLLIYARASSGYRSGSPNPVSSINVGRVPNDYKPDKTRNYEVGLKGSFFDRKLTIDTSIFYIDWNNIQVGVLDVQSASVFTSNVGGAYSKGVEFSAAVRPTRGLSISGWLVYNNAKIDTAFPSGTQIAAQIGDRLPNSAPWTGNLAVDYEFDASAEVKAFLGGSASFVDDRLSVFRNGRRDRFFLPHYEKIDLKAGARWDGWELTAYVNNIADKRGVLNIATTGLQYFLLQPRTIGLSIERRF